MDETATATQEHVEEALKDLQWLLDWDKSKQQITRQQINDVLNNAVAVIENLWATRPAPPEPLPVVVDPWMGSPHNFIGYIRDVSVTLDVGHPGRPRVPIGGIQNVEMRRQIFDGHDFRDWDTPEATAILNVMFWRIGELERRVKGEISGEQPDG